jgi:hypothetical protein
MNPSQPAAGSSAQVLLRLAYVCVPFCNANLHMEMRKALPYTIGMRVQAPKEYLRAAVQSLTKQVQMTQEDKGMLQMRWQDNAKKAHSAASFEVNIWLHGVL